MIPWGEIKNDSHLPSSVFHENRDITDPNIIANMYNDYFKNTGKNSYKSQWKHIICEASFQNGPYVARKINRVYQ